VLFKAFAKQDEFTKAALSGNFNYLMYGGSIRSGKTFLMVALILLLARIYPGSRWAICRKDLPTLRRNLLPVFNKLRPEGFCEPVNQSTWSSKCSNGSEILFFTESIKDDPDLNRWKGLEVNGFGLDEANEFMDLSFYKAQERAGSWLIPATPENPKPRQPKPLILLTVNPAPGWVRRIFYDPWHNKSLTAPYFFLQALPKDNPYLPQEYLDSLENLPELEYRRYVLGDWDTVEGAAFSELRLETHLLSPEEMAAFSLRPWWAQWSAADWGFAHPFAGGGFTLSDDGTIYVLDSVRRHGLLDTEQAQEMTRILPAKSLLECWSGADMFARRKAHEGATATVAEVWAEFGIQCERALTDRVPGWQSVRRAISVRAPNPATGRPRLRWLDTPANRDCIISLMGMVIDPDSKTGEDVLKVDADREGHGGDDYPDMLRYGIATKVPPGEMPVNEKSPEDYLAEGRDPNQKFGPKDAEGIGPNEEDTYEGVLGSGWSALDQFPEGF